jgi:hypothetical protein
LRNVRKRLALDLLFLDPAGFGRRGPAETRAPDAIPEPPVPTLEDLASPPPELVAEAVKAPLPAGAGAVYQGGVALPDLDLWDLLTEIAELAQPSLEQRLLPANQPTTFVRHKP